MAPNILLYSKYSRTVAITAMIGMVLSYYAYHVEMHVEHDSNYHPMCDINEKISCSKVFESEYGKGFGIVGKMFGQKSCINQPNSLYGILFYVLLALLGYINDYYISKILLGICIVANFASIYLAYLLYFVLHSFCVVCVATYFVNFILLLFVIRRHRLLVRNDEVMFGKFD